MTSPQGASRAINERIAIEVMGWTRWENYETGDWEGPDDVTFFAPWDDDGSLSVYTPVGDGDVSFYFDPATDIADAWLVVDAMRAKGFCFSLSDMPGESFVRSVATFTTTPMLPSHDEYNECAVSPALAICLAALAALAPPHPDTDR